MIAKMRFRIRDCCIVGFGMAVIGLGVAWAGNMVCDPKFGSMVDAILDPNTNITCTVVGLCSSTNHTFIWSTSKDCGATYTTNNTQKTATASLVAPRGLGYKLIVKCEIGGHKPTTLGSKSVFVVVVWQDQYPRQDMPNQIREGNSYVFALEVRPTNTVFSACSQSFEPNNGGRPFAILTGTASFATVNWSVPSHRRNDGGSTNLIESDAPLGEITRWFAQIPGDNRLKNDVSTYGNASMCDYSHAYSLTVGNTELKGKLGVTLYVDVAGRAFANTENVKGFPIIEQSNSVWQVVDIGDLKRYTPTEDTTEGVDMTGVEADSVFRNKVYRHECEHVRQARTSDYFTDVVAFYMTNLEGKSEACLEKIDKYVSAAIGEYRYSMFCSINSSNSVLETEMGAIIEEQKYDPDYLELNERQILEYAGSEYRKKEEIMRKLRIRTNTLWSNYYNHTCN